MRPSPCKLISQTVEQGHRGGGNNMRISGMEPPCIDELHRDFKKEVTQERPINVKTNSSTEFDGLPVPT
jgi:hypothetical protein